MSLRAKLVVHSRVITLAVTPESIAPAPGTSELSSDVIIQAKSTNTQPCLIGGEGNELFELPANAVISLSDVFHTERELEFDLDEIFCKVGADGEGVNVLRTEVVSV